MTPSNRRNISLSSAKYLEVRKEFFAREGRHLIAKLANLTDQRIEQIGERVFGTATEQWLLREFAARGKTEKELATVVWRQLVRVKRQFIREIRQRRELFKEFHTAADDLQKRAA